MDEEVPWVFNHTSSFGLATISSCSKKKSLITFIDSLAGGPQQHRILRMRWGFASFWGWGFATLKLPPGLNWQCTSSSMDSMLLKRAGGINNQKEGEDDFHVDVFLK